MNRLILSCSLIFGGINLNAQSSASQSAQALSQGATINIMIGGALLMFCMSEQKPNMLVCMLGGLALAQGMSMNQQANQAQQVANSTATIQPIILQSYPTTTIVNTPVAAIPTLPTTVNGLNTINAAGYRVSSAGITLPNGQFVPASVAKVPAGMASMGFDTNTVRTAQQAVLQTSQRVSRQLASGAR